MKKYEVMYILKANLDDATRNELVGKLNALLSANGGSIESVNEWGVKDLAYEIEKEKKGYDVQYATAAVMFVDVVANVDAINEFDRVAKINSNVLRSLVIAK